MSIYGKPLSGGKKSVSSHQCGRNFRDTNPKGVKPPGSFAPTPDRPISQRKRMAGID
jgi:hypothetical protein